MPPLETVRGEWRFFSVASGVRDSAGAAAFSGALNVVAQRLRNSKQSTLGAAVTLVVPLERCILMAVDLPPLHGTKLQQALSGLLGDKLIGTSIVQHYVAAPIDNGRIREAAACDAAWLKQRLDAVAAVGLRVERVIPEACLIPKGSAWWGQLQAEQSPSWLVRAPNGEAVRVAAHLLDAVLPHADDASGITWQWLVDPACDPPPARDTARYTAMTTAALLQGASHSIWELRQSAFAPPDGVTRFMQWCTQHHTPA